MAWGASWQRRPWQTASFGDGAHLKTKKEALQLQQDGLLQTGDKVLLAVSGGLDSVVMAHLLHGLGYATAVAHCNFQLRGADADGDEAFVKDLAKQLDLLFYSTKFDTKGYAKQHGRHRLEVRAMRSDSSRSPDGVSEASSTGSPRAWAR
jgi:3'-phosphoadenosine 5'-phosphosulfate sulfotransferase (PAPS reductase)/FAD synthetase